MWRWTILCVDVDMKWLYLQWKPIIRRYSFSHIVKNDEIFNLVQLTLRRWCDLVLWWLQHEGTLPRSVRVSRVRRSSADHQWYLNATITVIETLMVVGLWCTGGRGDSMPASVHSKENNKTLGRTWVQWLPPVMVCGTNKHVSSLEKHVHSF